NMKLEKRIGQRRADLLAADGVELRTSCDVGRDVSARELLEGYDAILLCCGAKKPRGLDAANGIKGAYFAVDFLASTTKALLGTGLEKGGYIDAAGRDVVIVGGGDTGNDCVGTAIRHGCKSVIQLEMMPKAPDSRAADNPWPQWPKVCKTDYGQEEAIAVFGSDPRRYQTTVKECCADETGALSSIVTVKLEPKVEDDRRIMVEVPSSKEELPCQLLLIAAGFLGPEDYVADAFGVGRDSRSNVATAPGGYATGIDKVFAAGDMRRGQSLVVWGIAEGRAAAREVDKYLMDYTNLT
ncbi:MAG: glutamate synthase, partial [Oscillospiraceae bacterium]|nr:glutamate synthase [Oscillospiraceae bacterium]